MDVVGTITDTLVLGLTDWQIQNLTRHTSCRFCCGSRAWMFYGPPNYIAIEVAANLETTPVIELLPQDPLPAWIRTFRHLCRVSGVIYNAYGAYARDQLFHPLTNYSLAMEEAGQRDIREAINNAKRCRCR